MKTTARDVLLLISAQPKKTVMYQSDKHWWTRRNLTQSFTSQIKKLIYILHKKSYEAHIPRCQSAFTKGIRRYCCNIGYTREWEDRSKSSFSSSAFETSCILPIILAEGISVNSRDFLMICHGSRLLKAVRCGASLESRFKGSCNALKYKTLTVHISLSTILIVS